MCRDYKIDTHQINAIPVYEIVTTLLQIYNDVAIEYYVCISYYLRPTSSKTDRVGNRSSKTVLTGRRTCACVYMYVSVCLMLYMGIECTRGWNVEY